MPVIAVERLRRRISARWRRWQDDRKGASLVQFIVVLPVFVVFIFGLYGVFQVMSARDTLCEATWEAARYLQVEGPHFPEDEPGLDYPDGWEDIATEIINQELASRTFVGLYPVERDKVEIWPRLRRRSPESTLNVSREELDLNVFFLRVTKAITNPLYASFGSVVDLSEDSGGMINLTCRRSAFYEGPPVKPTFIQRGGSSRDCPRPPLQCPPKGGATDTPRPGAGTPTVCPTCRP